MFGLSAADCAQSGAALEVVGTTSWWWVFQDQRILGGCRCLAVPALVASPEQRVELLATSRSTSRPHWVIMQARELLLAADEIVNAEIARRCRVDADAVRAGAFASSRSGQ